MKAVVALLIVVGISAIFTSALGCNIVGSALKTGQSLNENDCLRSPSGTFYAVLQTDGNFVIYTGTNFVPSNSIWSTATANKGTSPRRLTMQSDANLVLYGKNNTYIWDAKCAGKGKGPWSLEMQNDMNLVIYDSQRISIWATNTGSAIQDDPSKEEPIR